MKKYNRRKRGAYNAQARHIQINDACSDTHRAQRIRIRIEPHYDGYTQTTYIHSTLIRTRDTRTEQYINALNTINDIFPEINAPHNAHTYRATAPYRKHPPEYIYREIPRYLRTSESDYIERDTRTVKCIIYNSDDAIIYIGLMRRTRVRDKRTGKTQITLHRNKRTLDAYDYIPPTTQIYNVSVAEIRAHSVEIYQI